jgi:hypothetical protein
MSMFEPLNQKRAFESVVKQIKEAIYALFKTFKTGA